MKLLLLFFLTSFIEDNRLVFQTNDINTYYSLIGESCAISSKIQFEKPYNCYSVYFSIQCYDSLEQSYLKQQ